MITNVSTPMVSKNLSNPSFGLAKLNTLGRTTADSFGYQNNQFLNSDMFKKQGIFQKSQLTQALAEDADFVQLCTTYGCSNNAKTNAEFIQNQILSSKSDSAMKKVDSEELNEGLLKLYWHNYDNPQLSLKSTKELLEKAKSAIAPEEYVKNVGLLQAGSKK